MAQQAAPDHRVLKAVVIGLGLLILLGFGALIVGLAAQGGKLGGPIAQPLALPKDASIAGMAMSERQLVLHVRTGAREELVLVDLRSGRVTGRIPIIRADAASAAETVH